MPTVSQNASTFVHRLSLDTGLNKSVLYGWVMAETSGYNTTNGANNWLNVGSFDSGFVAGGANVWNDPISAADATASFMLGKPVHGVTSPVGPGSSSIQAIASTAKQSIGTQISAIQDSDWASSHYSYNLASDVQPFTRGKINISKSMFTRPGGEGASSSTSYGSGPSSGADTLTTQFASYDSSSFDSAPTTQYTGLLSDLTAPFTWWWGNFSHSFDNLEKSVTGPLNSVYDVGHGIDEMGGEMVKILSLWPWYMLRFAEFMSGIFLMAVGFYMVITSRPRRSVVSSMFAATPLGRFGRVTRARREGSREGQAEYHRNEARRQGRAREAERMQRQGQGRREQRVS